MLWKWQGGEGDRGAEGPVENEVQPDLAQKLVSPFSNFQDYYICKLSSCQTMIMFENCGARSKILNHYTSHFQVHKILNILVFFHSGSQNIKVLLLAFLFKLYFLQRELEDQFGHLLTEEMQCTLCSKQLGNYIKSKVSNLVNLENSKLKADATSWRPPLRLQLLENLLRPGGRAQAPGEEVGWFSNKFCFDFYQRKLVLKV